MKTDLLNDRWPSRSDSQHPTSCSVSQDLALEDIPIIAAMENALKSPNLPPWIGTLILNLAEFMEMQVGKNTRSRLRGV
jgi:hypothetical protein